LGRAAAFLRLANCPVGCVWCDTRYTWDFPAYVHAEEVSFQTVEECWQAVEACLPPGPQPLLVVTGGEPLMQADALRPLLQAAAARPCRVEVETSGVHGPGDLVEFVDLFTVSPKLAHSEVPESRRLRWDVLTEFSATDKSVFKFVVAEPAQLDEVAAIAARIGIDSVTIMPLGTDPAEVAQRLRLLAEPVAHLGWTLTPRLHIDVWGNRRGH